MIIKRIIKNLSVVHVFIMIALSTGLVFAVMTPPLWGLDEPSHFIRAYSIAQGNISPSHTDKVPDNLLNIAGYRNNDILDVVKGSSVLDRTDVTSRVVYDELDGPLSYDEGEGNFVQTSSYSPVSYIGAIIGILIAKLLGLTSLESILVARIFSLIVYIALAAYSIWIVRDWKVKWMFFVIALAPTAIFQASVVTADSMAIGLSLIFSASFIRLLLDKKYDKTILWSLAISAILLPLTKINYIFLSLGVIFAPQAVFKLKKVSISYKLLTVCIALILSWVWMSLVKPVSSPAAVQRDNQSSIIPGEQIMFIISHPYDFVTAIIRSIIQFGDYYYNSLLFLVSGNSVAIPSAMVLLFSFSLIVVAVYAKSELLLIKKWILILSGLSFVGILTIFAALYVAFNPVGSPLVAGIQGRYFFPFLPMFISMIAIMVPFTIQVKEGMLKISIYTICTACLIVSLLYGYIALY